MRHLTIALALIFSLSACNMTMGNQPNEQENNETIALTTHTPSIAQQPASEQVSAPTQTPRPTNTTAPQSVAAAVLPSCTVRADWQIYTVASGDTLGQIAQRSGTDSGTLAAANCLSDANAISVGQALRVPSVPAPAPVVSSNTTASTANLRMVGNYMGFPGYDSCWAHGNGLETPTLIYDRIDGTPIAYVGNRVLIVSAAPPWVQVSVEGTKTIPETTGWIRIADTRLVGFCTEALGVKLDSFRGRLYGSQTGIPDGVCVVAPNDSTRAIPISYEMGGWATGELNGWGKWVSTEGNYYQLEFSGSWDGEPYNTHYVWADASLTHLVNC